MMDNNNNFRNFGGSVEPEEGPKAKAVFVKNPQIDISAEYRVPILYGPKTVRKQVTRCSNISNSNIGYSEKIPQNSLIERRAAISAKFTVTITGTAVSGNIWKQGTGAPRYMPLHGVTSTAEVKINGESVSTPVYSYITALGRYFDDHDYRHDLTGAPVMLDQAQEYAQTSSSPLNPLGEFIGNDFQPPRGCQGVYFNVVSNSPTLAVIDITTVEPLMVSPFYWGHSSKTKPAFANVTTMDVSYNLGKLDRVWSHDNITNPITNYNISVNVVESELMYTILSPQDDRPVNPDATYYYDYYNLQQFPTNVGTVAAGASSTITTNMITPPNVPVRMFVYIREKDANRSSLTSDVFANITDISVQWNNNTFLSSANEYQLWKIGQQNGLYDNWVSWKRYGGSVLALEFAKDIGLDFGQVPGMVLNNQLLLTIKFVNPNTTRSIDYQCYIITTCPGIFEINNGTGRANLGVITAADVLLARQSPFLSYEEVVGMQPYGGSFWSSLANAGKKVLSGVGKAARFVAPIAAPLLNVASMANPGMATLANVALDAAQRLPGGYVIPEGMELRRKRAKKGKKGGYVLENNNELMKRLSM